MASNDQETTPIGLLYDGIDESTWKVKARITFKSKDIKYYNGAKGEGKLFSVDIMDN